MKQFSHIQDNKLSLPTRLLDVGSSDSLRVYLRLKEEVEEHPRYITLSHCWGNVVGYRLFDSTCDGITVDDARKEGIEIKHLPANFAEAIDATQSLGFRYLWIDSLCIMQNSTKD